MDASTLVVELVKALAWPLTILIIALFLKDEIRQLISGIKTARWGDKEVEFRQRVEQLASEAEVQLKEPGFDEDIDEESAFSRAYRLLEYSRRAAIIEAWIELEEAIKDVYTTYIDLKPPSHISVVRMAETLHNEGFLDKEDRDFFDSLWNLRNDAVHNADFDTDVHTARLYVDISRRLASQVRRKLREKQKS
jgi:hypothetical protein